nr:RNA polymerase sigma factor [Paenibacillus hamazuiensis]
MEAELARRARAGDSAAFGELVHRYRAKAFGIARRIARDPHIAEDVVQEALLQAYRHIRTLADVDRFAPWLSRIVRNQALMNVRRAGARPPETTFTGVTGRGHALAGDDSGSRDLDSLLYRLTRSGGTPDAEADPEHALLRREFFTAIQEMMHGLSAKERDVFEAHFFDRLSPQEIARLLAMPETSVYKFISRSRQKVKENRLRHYLRDRIREEAGARDCKAVTLPLRAARETWEQCRSSLAACLYLLLRHTGICGGIGLSETMGFTGQAFRISVESRRIDASGPHMYFWEPAFAQGLANLGLVVRHVGDGGMPPSSYMLGEALGLIRWAIASGAPVIAWDLFQPEFGLLYGYDDDRQLLIGDDGQGAKKLAYERLGQGAAGGLFVMTVEKGAGRPETDQAVSQLIGMITAHAYGEKTFPGYVCGLPAYDAWQRAFRERAVDPLGNAYTLRIAADAREHAVRFLRGLSGRWQGEKARLLFDAEGHYYEAAACLARLAAMFPFPGGGRPLDPDLAGLAIAHLAEAREHEAAGIETLGRLSRILN